MSLLQEWKLQISGYSRTIRLFLLFQFVWNVGISMFQLVYNLYVKALGYEQTMVGDIVGMTALAAAITLLPAGILNDRIGAKRLVTTGVVAVIGVFAARALLDGGSALLASAFLGGMSLAIVSVTVLPFMTDHSTPEQRVHLFSLNLALVMGASVVGNVISGSLTDLLQYGAGLDPIASLRVTLLMGVGIAALGLIPVLSFSSGTAGRPAAEPVPLREFRTLWRNHRTSLQVIGMFAFLGLLSSCAGGMVVPYLNVYFEDRFAVSRTAIGVIVSLGQGATALAFLIGPLFAKRFGEAKSVVLLQLSSIPFLLLTAYSNHFYAASAGYLFRQALMNAATPFYNTIKMRYVDRSLRGVAASSGEAMFNLGWYIAAPISTGLVVRYGAYYGYAYAFTITAIVYTLISILFYAWFSKDRFREAEQQ